LKEGIKEREFLYTQYQGKLVLKARFEMGGLNKWLAIVVWTSILLAQLQKDGRAVRK
jgi:hypothetical protein